TPESDVTAGIRPSRVQRSRARRETPRKSASSREVSSRSGGRVGSTNGYLQARCLVESLGRSFTAADPGRFPLERRASARGPVSNGGLAALERGTEPHRAQDVLSGWARAPRDHSWTLVGRLLLAPEPDTGRDDGRGRDGRRVRCGARWACPRRRASGAPT